MLRGNLTSEMRNYNGRQRQVAHYSIYWLICRTRKHEVGPTTIDFSISSIHEGAHRAC